VEDSPAGGRGKGSSNAQKDHNNARRGGERRARKNQEGGPLTIVLDEKEALKIVPGKKFKNQAFRKRGKGGGWTIWPGKIGGCERKDQEKTSKEGKKKKRVQDYFPNQRRGMTYIRVLGEGKSQICHEEKSANAISQKMGLCPPTEQSTFMKGEGVGLRASLQKQDDEEHP